MLDGTRLALCGGCGHLQNVLKESLEELVFGKDPSRLFLPMVREADVFPLDIIDQPELGEAFERLGYRARLDISGLGNVFDPRDLLLL